MTPQISGISWCILACSQHWEVTQHLMFTHLHQDWYCLLWSVTLTCTCKSLVIKLSYGRCQEYVFLQFTAVLWVCERGFHPSDCPPYNLISPVPVLYVEPRWKIVNLKPPSVTWNKLQLPFTIKFSVIWFTVIISKHVLFIHTQPQWSINPNILSPTEDCFSMRTREGLPNLHLNLGAIDALVWRFQVT